MIVSELIKKLEELNPFEDMTVLGRGYENGYNALDPEEIRILTLVKCENEWYDGTYQPIWNGEPSTGKPLDTPKEYICLE